jgi:tetratricopeptide (TPR) repeat protein
MLRAGQPGLLKKETIIDTPTLQQVQSALRTGRGADAKVLLRRVLTTAPNDLRALHGMAVVCTSLGDVDDGIDAYRRLIRLTPESLPLINELAQFCHRQGRLDVAIREYERYLARHPDSTTAEFNCAYYLGKLGRARQAIDHYLKAWRLGMNEPEIHINIANLYAESLRDDVQARTHLERALAMAPGHGGALFNLANLAEQQGNIEEARSLFRKCLGSGNPGHVSPLARLADTYDFSEGHDELLADLQSAAGQAADADLHLALARALEQRRNYADAWQHYTIANQTDRKQMPPYDRGAWEQRVAKIITTCTPEWLATLQQPRDWAPVFICGMFRSGSTLVEQILAAHPAFQPAGEREFFPRLISTQLPGYPEGLEAVRGKQLKAWASQYRKEMLEVFGSDKRLTDKRPDNFLFIGLIKAMFPQAKVVVTRRDWRDVAVSLYATRLGTSASYSTDLGDIRHFTGLHDQLIAHWQSLLGDDLIEVQYEELVADLRGQTGYLLSRLGEEWDEQCLRFHELRNTVRTASVWQVRQPLYASSVGRWTRYREQFVAAFGETVG